MIASLIGDVASLLAALAALVAALVSARVHREVKTANGLTMAALADRQEGRRIRSDVPVGERSKSERHYVEQLNEPEDP